MENITVKFLKYIEGLLLARLCKILICINCKVIIWVYYYVRILEERIRKIQKVTKIQVGIMCKSDI